jgi:hypothetical protein
MSMDPLASGLHYVDASQSLTAPVPPVQDLLHAECTSSVLLSLQHNAEQASTALNAAAAQWPAAASFDASGLVHPHMPDNFSYYYEAAERGKCSSSPKNTDSKLFWNCEFEEVVYSRKTLAAKALCSLFEELCIFDSQPKTTGHEHWLPKQPEMLVKLWSAAKVLDTLGTRAITLAVLKPYWRAHSDSVLEALQQWIPTLPHGSPACAASNALSNALQLIRTDIPDLLTF